MNSDLYYLKYKKYKTKYLIEKNKIGGGDCNGDVVKKNLLIGIVLGNLNIYENIKKIFDLLKKNPSNKEIEDIISNIYNQNVFALKNLDKDCLKVKLIKNFSNNKDNKYAKPKDFSELNQYSNFEYSNGTYKSLNITTDETKKFNKAIGNTGEFARGTSFIKEEPDYKKRNLRYLTNLINISYSIDDTKKIESMRFGTPLDTKVPEVPQDSKDSTDLKATKKKNFYQTQIDILKTYIGPKRCFFVSLLDVCDSVLCIAAPDKKSENNIIKEEIEGYHQTENIVYLNMSCNNNVNTPSIASVMSEDYKDKLKVCFERIEKWIEDSGNDALKNLKKNNTFFEKFKKNVLDNDFTDPYLVNQLNIKKFVLKEEIKQKADTLKSLLDNDPKKYTPCEVELKNENIRLVMFCYISLIFYIFSREKIGGKEYILLYHCKSGQDRTGTFYAINQMVNEITTKHYDPIITYINTPGTNFIDLFKHYYSLTRKFTSLFNPATLKEDCPKDKTILNTKIETNSKDKINKDVEACYLKYLLFSYNITLTSTGCPGLKWSLAHKKLMTSVDNKFPYLLLTDPYSVILFEGASSMRGS